MLEGLFQLILLIDRRGRLLPADDVHLLLQLCESRFEGLDAAELLDHQFLQRRRPLGGGLLLRPCSDRRQRMDEHEGESREPSHVRTSAAPPFSERRQFSRMRNSRGWARALSRGPAASCRESSAPARAEIARQMGAQTKWALVRGHKLCRTGAP